MKLSLEPSYQDRIYRRVNPMPWGYRQYIAGQACTRRSVNRRKLHASEHDRSALKILLGLFFSICMIIVSREALASEGPQAGEMSFTASDGTKSYALQLQSSTDIHVKGLHAQVTLTQSFKNQTGDWVEGVYVFPLPTDSAVNAMTMTIGERVINADIREREEAKKIYTQAKRAGKKTALIEQERPNLFTQSVANIAPGEKITVTLNYLQPVVYNLGTFSLRLPMTITERFSPSINRDSSREIPGSFKEGDEIPLNTSIAHFSEGWGYTEVTDVPRITPPMTTHKNTMRVSVLLDSGIELAQVESPSHSVSVTESGSSTYAIKPINQFVAMDRDFELQWQPVKSKAPLAAAFHETFDDESYVQIMLLPPHIDTSGSARDDSVLARELILIIDTSGSMQGQSIEQAKKSVSLALRKLTPEDTFNVIEFNSAHSALFEEPRQATADNIQQALHMVGMLGAGGGTNMLPALAEALKVQTGSEQLKQIVFVTDGAVGNEQGLFKLIHEHLQSARLFTVGIGSAPNSHFMEKAAQFGRGTFTYISSVNQVDERMGELFRKLESPVMSGVEVQWPSGWDMDAYPVRIPDLYFGEPMIITAKANPGMVGNENISISGEVVGARWSREMAIPKPKAVYIKSDDSFADKSKAIIPSHWARFKMDDLLDQQTMGVSREELKLSVLPLALKYQLMSPFTSFVAVEEEMSRPKDSPLDTSKVANTLPAGQTAKKIAYPSTAMGLSANLILGLMAFLFAVFLTFMSRVERV